MKAAGGQPALGLNEIKIEWAGVRFRTPAHRCYCYSNTKTLRIDKRRLEHRVADLFRHVVTRCPTSPLVSLHDNVINRGLDDVAER